MLKSLDSSTMDGVYILLCAYLYFPNSYDVHALLLHEKSSLLKTCRMNEFNLFLYISPALRTFHVCKVVIWKGKALGVILTHLTETRTSIPRILSKCQNDITHMKIEHVTF